MARRSRDFPLFSGPPYSSTIKSIISEVQGASGAGGEKTIAAHHEVHPNQVTASKAQVLENLPGLLAGFARLRGVKREPRSPAISPSTTGGAFTSPLSYATPDWVYFGTLAATTPAAA